MENEIKKPNIKVETYADDMAGFIEGSAGGMVKKIIHGEEENEAEKKSLSPESKKNKFFMITSIFLLVLAVGILLFFFFTKKPNTVEVPPQFVPLIFNDLKVPIEITGLKTDDIIQDVANEVNTTKVKQGGLEGIYLTLNKQVIGLREFVSLIKANLVLPSDTQLVSDNFLMGVVKGSQNSFFVLLKMNSISDIFDPLRSWEAKMFSDLHGFLGINLSSDTNYLLTKNFEDGIIENKNARVLYDNDGNPVLMYIFADDNSVVITNTQEAAHQIMLLLASSKASQ